YLQAVWPFYSLTSVKDGIIFMSNIPARQFSPQSNAFPKLSALWLLCLQLFFYFMQLFLKNP
ncbi:MAG: hypothetical protein ACLS7L_07290, partial [Clostridium sp.]